MKLFLLLPTVHILPLLPLMLLFQICSLHFTPCIKTVPTGCMIYFALEGKKKKKEFSYGLVQYLRSPQDHVHRKQQKLKSLMES